MISSDVSIFCDSTEFVLIKTVIDALKEKDLMKLRTSLSTYNEVNNSNVDLNLFLMVIKLIENFEKDLANQNNNELFNKI